MKTYRTILAIGLAAVFPTVALAQSENPYVANVTIEKKLHLFTPLTPSTITEPKDKIERYGNMSSQPWAQIVGWHPGTSQFPDADTHESKLDLIWIGHEPWQ